MVLKWFAEGVGRVPGDDRKISVMACVFLVTLRLFIGWHLLYEGLWKLQTQDTASPWTAEGYLKNATGPLRPLFRDLTGDPNDARWLDYDQVISRWEDWRKRFVNHYGATPEEREALSKGLARLLDGPGTFTAPLTALPPGVDPADFPRSVKYDAQRKILVNDGQMHLLPTERDALLALVDSAAAVDGTEKALVATYRAAVERLYTGASSLSYRERLAVSLKADPERAGLLIKGKDGSDIEKRLGDIELYRELSKQYEDGLRNAKVAYQFDHLDKMSKDLTELRNRLLGPVKSMDSELKVAAEKLLSEAQLARGPVPEPMSKQRSIDLQTMWGLTIIGLLLIAGLATRIAAVAGAGLLMLFYLAAPPWPGMPEVPGPEHNYIVNKVLIEATALLAFAFLPTGRWFGIDAIFSALFRRRRMTAE